jgi:hypothetical protein
MIDDRLNEELRGLDPVQPGSLDGAAGSDAAAGLLARILAEDPAAGADRAADAEPRAEGSSRRGHDQTGRPCRRDWWRPRSVTAALAGLAAVAVVAAALVAIFAGSSSTGSGPAPDRLAAALDRAAAVAGAQPQAGVDRPYSYLKTRELAVDTTVADEHSWHISQVTTREEWMTPDGPARMRITAGPSHFVGATDRLEWERAGRPGFLALGFGPRTEVHWLAGDVIRRRVLDLPTDPAALAVRLRQEAQAEAGELPLPAATLRLIAEDLRSPMATPRLRRALYEAAKLVPGIGYFGARIDAEGRQGVAIGVSGLGPDGKAQFALIFDPATARPLSTEEISPTGAGAGPTIRRVTTYVEAPEVLPPAVDRATL